MGKGEVYQILLVFSHIPRCMRNMQPSSCLLWRKILQKVLSSPGDEHFTATAAAAGSPDEALLPRYAPACPPGHSRHDPSSRLSPKSQQGHGLPALHISPPSTTIPATSLPSENWGQTEGRANLCCYILYKAVYRNCGKNEIMLEMENFQVLCFKSLQSSNFGAQPKRVFLVFAPEISFEQSWQFSETKEPSKRILRIFFKSTFAFVFERGFGSTVKQHCFSSLPLLFRH